MGALRTKIIEEMKLRNALSNIKGLSLLLVTVSTSQNRRKRKKERS